MKTSKGLRFGTRQKLRRKFNEKFTITEYMQEFKEGEKVIVKINPASQKGMPHHRFKGGIGVVKGRRGSSFIIKINDGNKEKTLISRPEHLKPVK